MQQNELINEYASIHSQAVRLLENSMIIIEELNSNGDIKKYDIKDHLEECNSYIESLQAMETWKQ